MRRTPLRDGTLHFMNELIHRRSGPILILTITFADSEVPAAVIKMEPQSQDQLARAAQHRGYQPTQYHQSDWTTTTTPPTAQEPIGVPPYGPDHRRELQAAGA
jgi:hypothetical protein